MPRVRAATAAEKIAHADAIIDKLKANGGMSLNTLLPGAANAVFRNAVLNGEAIPGARAGSSYRVITQPIAGTTDHDVIAVAALVQSDPGATKSLIEGIDDYAPFQVALPKPIEIPSLWYQYQNEGAVNNAINKLASALSSGGSFKVTSAKKGKTQNAQQQLQAGLNEFNLNVNNAPLDGVVTGSRGLKAVLNQGARTALVEGDWFARTTWVEHQVPQFAPMSMPMIIQTMTTAQIVAATEVQGYGIEAYYWKPPASLVQQIQKPTNKDTAKLIKRFLDSDWVGQLKKTGQVFLDPSLCIHIKHRGCDFQPFGESFIKSAQQSIAYKRALDNLDYVTITSLINRMTVIQVGASANPDSRYNDPIFSAQRAQLFQNFLANPGPYMAIVWQGDDIKIQDIGAHNQLADTKDRHMLAMNRLQMAMGVPSAMLTGTTEQDGKAAGWAATIASTGQLEEIRNAMGNAMTTMGQRIAVENNFQQYEISYEFNNSLFADKAEEWNQARLDYQQGTISIRKYCEIRDIDPDVMFMERCDESGADPSTATFAQVFVPLAGLPGQGTEPLADGGGTGKPAMPPGTGGGKPPAQGRPAGNPSGQTAKPPTEKKSPNENR